MPTPEEWDSAVEKAIRRAMEEGQFDDLPGAGKPLDLGENPFEDPAAWAANRLLRNNDLAPAWIQERRGIEADIEAARERLARSWRWYYALTGGQGGTWADDHWKRAETAFRDTVADLNRRIRDYNLKAPFGNLQRAPLDVEKEIERVKRGNQ